MKKRMKTRILQLVLMAAMVLSLGVPVYAAVEEINEDIARGSTQYESFNLTIYSGVMAYTPSGQNFSNSAYVKVENSTLSSIQMGLYDNSHQTIWPLRLVSVPIGFTFSPAHNYPGQYICVGFYKTNIEGVHSISGKFYYDGL